MNKNVPHSFQVAERAGRGFQCAFSPVRRKSFQQGKRSVFNYDGKQRFSKLHPQALQKWNDISVLFPMFFSMGKHKMLNSWLFLSFILSVSQLPRHTLYFSLFSPSEQWRGETIPHTAFKPGCVSIVLGKKMARFPPPNQNTYVVGGFLSQNTTFGYFILSAIYNFLKMSEHLMQVEWLEWTSPWNQFTCKVWNLFEYHLNSQWLLVD